MDSVKDIISFDEFAKLDLRVGKIIECEPIDGSEKLYKLTVRIGEETRTIASGIAQHYAPDELLGKRIVLISNLAPKEIMGIESKECFWLQKTVMENFP